MINLIHPNHLKENEIEIRQVVNSIICGSGTTLIVAKKLGRKFIGIDINKDYCEIAKRRLEQVQKPLL